MRRNKNVKIKSKNSKKLLYEGGELIAYGIRVIDHHTNSCHSTLD